MDDCSNHGRNLALNFFGYWVAHIDSIAKGMDSKELKWTPAASGVLAAEFAAIVLLLGFAYFYQSRKQDYI